MKKIAVTGYYGTGSSAVIDLLAEVGGVSCALGRRYEHTNLNCAGGLFDLEARLYHENANYYSRDIALNDFYNEMYKQYRYNFGWYGSYKKLFGEKYMQAVDAFMDKISVSGDKNCLAHTVKTRFSLVKACGQLALKALYKRKYGVLGCKYVHDKDPQRFLCATHEEFMQAAREFVGAYFGMCQSGDDDMIYDHLLFPEQANVAARYFDDDFRLIIVDRDPRDIYISDKFLWSTPKYGSQIMPMPRDLDGFCGYWLAMHERAAENKGLENVLFVQFEDLIYNYDETVKEIFDFCGIDGARHIKKKVIFVPENSLHNTQVFNMVKGAESICAAIEEKLPQLIYNFPYKHKGDENKFFD